MQFFVDALARGTQQVGQIRLRQVQLDERFGARRMPRAASVPWRPVVEKTQALAGKLASQRRRQPAPVSHRCGTGEVHNMLRPIYRKGRYRPLLSIVWAGPKPSRRRTR